MKNFMIKTIIFLFVLVVVSFKVAVAADVQVAWDANTEPDLAGYKVFWDVVNPPVANEQDVGNVTSYTITGLTEGQIVYIGAKAYDTDGNESAMSDILQYIPRTAKLIIIIDAPQGLTTQ